ncbi:MAG: GNAT family N-acetyltransferase [Calditrichaeota bacterium]|nr:GNAT family N-acetyltransferase [Calditrichota bacterium]
MSVIRVDTERGFQALAKDWNRVLERSYSPEIFRTWEWQYAWWQTFGQELDLRIFAVQEGAEIVAVAPLYVRRVSLAGLRTVNVVRLIADDVIGSDFLDWLVPQEAELALVGELVDSILADFDGNVVFDFRDVAADSVVARRVLPALAERGLVSRQMFRYLCPYLELPGTFEQFMRNLGSSTRESLRRKARKLEREHDVQLVLGGDQVAAEDALRALWDLHERRWQGRGEDSCQRPGFKDFHDRLLTLLRRNVLLYLLRVDGRFVAGQYNFRFLDRIYQYQSGFDPDTAELSPGTVLMLKVLEDAVARGASRFELLRGDESYKGRFTRTNRATFKIVAARSRALLGAYTLPDTLRRTKRGALKVVGSIVGTLA